MLTQHEVEWIIALKDNKEKVFYEHHYGSLDNVDMADVIALLLKIVVDKEDGWAKVINMMYLNLSTYQQIKGTARMTLNEWIALGIKSWCNSRTRQWFNKHAPLEWKLWVNDLREEGWYNE